MDNGLPEDIVTDWGPQFTSRVWENFANYQANGQVERLNQEIGHCLRTYCSQEQQMRSQFLSWSAQNSP